MGNRMTHVGTGVREQAAGQTKKLYNFVDVKGGGELVALMKNANRTKNYTLLDQRIKDGLRQFLYNNGEGKIVHISELVAARCAHRGMPVEVPSVEKPPSNYITTEDGLYRSTDGEHLKEHGSQYKKICWKLEEMGAVAETVLHVCLLNGTSVHADLAKRLITVYPALINDIYISDEFYGENALHIAIVNEDPAMVKFLLDNGADYHQRACGNFFTPIDQKEKRKDSFLHEWFDVPVKTNYEGNPYWGEYPLGFAACVGQEECVRLLIARGADPNLQDFNGNTVLHLLVIHDNKDMFDLLVDVGAKLHTLNRQGLSPLTLAAKLGRREMYEHILEIDREVFWIYGTVTCAAYPLEHIDTISSTGDININSAVYHVVYGEDRNHLDMIDGVISQLLYEKWRIFAKSRFLWQFFFFSVYFVFFVLAFLLRPGTDTNGRSTIINTTDVNGSYYLQNVTVKNSCFLLDVTTPTAKARAVFELITVFGSILYMFAALREIYHQGYRIYFRTLMSSQNGLFLLSNILIIMMVPGRAACAYIYEDLLSVAVMLLTAPYFLFFCRGFRIVGPFVVMIMKMIRTDLLRFFIIDLIFVIGFSQSMYIMFRGMPDNIFSDPLEAMMGMFIVSLGQFADMYDSFILTPISPLPQMVFLVYMIMVTLLLINMLIAMMTNTYVEVNNAQNEWLRQWAKIILMVEQTVTTDSRRLQRLAYSQPMADTRRALVIRWHQTEKEQEELRVVRTEEKVRQLSLLKKRKEARKFQPEFHPTCTSTLTSHPYQLDEQHCRSVQYQS